MALSPPVPAQYQTRQMNADAAVTAAVKGIWQIAIDLYEEHGFQATIDLGEKLALPFGYCEPCDNDTATLDGACLSCSSPKE